MGLDRRFVQIWVLLADAIGHQPARALEQPGTLEEFVRRQHRARPRHLLAVQHVDECGDGLHSPKTILDQGVAPIVITTLPFTLRAAINLNASAARSSGNVADTCGLSRPSRYHAPS